MRTVYLIPALVGVIGLTNSSSVSAQTSKAYAITGQTKGDVSWMSVRQIDLSTGSETRQLFAPGNTNTVILDALTGARLSVNSTGAVARVNSNDNSITAPTETMVAAAAYDKNTNRLFFTPMHSNELRYLDLSKNDNVVYYVQSSPLKTFAEKSEGDVITRMCFGSDGYGYALTNDGNHLIRFSTGQKITVSDLGKITDGEDNEDISIRNMCTSWGGDMVADAMGNLYVISMKKNVFKINPQTRVADYMGAINNLPQDFMINGAAVDENSKVIVSSASNTDNYYSVDLATLEATVLPKQQGSVYNASDLASGHLLYETSSDSKALVAEVTGNSKVSIYPNPAINKNFQVIFDKSVSGSQTIQLSDVSGRTVLSKIVNADGSKTATVALPSSVKGGVYVIKINDGNGRVNYSGKIVVY